MADAQGGSHLLAPIIWLGLLECDGRQASSRNGKRSNVGRFACNPAVAQDHDRLAAVHEVICVMGNQDHRDAKATLHVEEIRAQSQSQP
jgi:hypothetical protein